MGCSKMKLDTSPCLAGSLICLLISLPCLAQNSADRAALGPDSSSPPEATATPEATAAPVEQTHSIERRMVSRLLTDQKEIWTSPFHTSRADARWWLIMGSTTAALIPADHWLATQLPNTADQKRFSRYFSNVGGSYLTYGIAGGLYLGGKIWDDPRAVETGVLSAEALTNALAVVEVIKLVTRRERPDVDNAKGHFFVGGSSFPSGHEIMSWALATVVASEYSDIKIVPIASYALATLVGASRFGARKHFASDVVAGAAMGWFIGRHIYHRWGTEPKSGPHPKIAALVPHFEPMVGGNALGMSLNWGH
jgi:membrane-associated phospholipid phosphatase